MERFVQRRQVMVNRMNTHKQGVLEQSHDFVERQDLFRKLWTLRQENVENKTSERELSCEIALGMQAARQSVMASSIQCD